MQVNIPKYTKEVRPPRLGAFPRWAKYGMYISVAASWVPLSLIVRGRYTRSNDPRVQLAQDMGEMPKYKEQQGSEVFADGRADRLPIPGTVARGDSHLDEHYYNGFTRTVDASGKATVKFFDAFPEQVKVTPALLARGRDRFNIYCTACHGYDGSGHGTVNERGIELSGINDEAGKPQATWVQAADLHSDVVRGRPVGHIYNTINVGIRNMPAYGPQVPEADRWAIVAYVRALQLSQDVPQDQVPADKRGELK
jgi:mono/diheme cytochrome c family protein